MATHACSLCPFKTASNRELVSHYVKKHRNAPNFVAHCNYPGCGASFKNYGSFKSHIARKHSLCESEALPSVLAVNGPVAESVPDIASTDASAITASEAAFMLKLKVGAGMSEEMLQETILSVRQLFQERVNNMRMQLQQNTSASQPNSSDLLNVLDCSDMFSQLDTAHKRDNFYIKNLGLVMPRATKLGERLVTKKIAGKYCTRKNPVFGYYVPVIEELKSFLSLPEVYSSVFQTTNEPDGIQNSTLMTDFTDGLYIRSNSFLKDHPNSILLSMYTDDFEVVNPIGSHRKVHKVTVFYMQVLNVKPHMRSRLPAVRLLAVARTRDIKDFGLDKLMFNFVESLMQLHQGVSVIINDNETTLHGCLVAVLADTPAAHAVGGFKEAVGLAKKPCRTCEIERDNIRNFDARSFIIRDELEHRDRCVVLNSLSKEARKYWSREHGINGQTFLAEIPNFQITKCLLQDPMHVLLEGVDRLVLKNFLRWLLNEKSIGITLNDLNCAISNFTYSESELLDKPQVFENKDFADEGSLHQTAASMKVLLQTLPFMIGKKIPPDEPHWLHFISLLQINLLCFSPFASSRTVSTLEKLIVQHNKGLVKLYGDHCIVPKVHFLMHLPQQLKSFGPLRHHWTMRHEAKHGLIKSKKWRNFKSIAKSVAEFHQRWQCMQETQGDGMRSSAVLYLGDEVGPGETKCLGDVLPNSISCSFDDQTAVNISPQVKIMGQMYKRGTVLVTTWDECDEPNFVEIESIIVIGDVKLFLCASLAIDEFVRNLNSFSVSKTTERILIQLHDLMYPWPQISHYVAQQKYVMLHAVDDAWTL